MNWDDWQFLLAAARSGSLAAAATALRVNETTVSRRLTRLENDLGLALFDRHPGRLVATDAGATVIRHAERVDSEIMAAQAALGQTAGTIAGTVRVTAVPFVINRLLAPNLPAFLAQHPGLRLDLIAEPRALSLTRREADIALRLAQPAGEQRPIARRIGDIRFAVYARKGVQPDALPWLTYEDRMAGLPQQRWIAQRLATAGHETTAAARFNDLEGIVEATRAGLGRSLLPIFAGDRDPGLQCVASETGLSRELWLLVHPDLRAFARVRVVMDWLAGLAQNC